MNGSIAQEDRVEVCVEGVWGSVCGSEWTKQTAFKKLNTSILRYKSMHVQYIYFYNENK